MYLSQCAVCHGEKMAGSPPAIPSLVGVGDRMSAADVAATIRNGKGRMPGFANLETDSEQWYGLLSYVMSGGKDGGTRDNSTRKWPVPGPHCRR